MSKSKVEYMSFVRKRFFKILIPYWIYAVFCCVLIVLCYYSISWITLSQVFNIFLSWAIPMDTQICTLAYLTWALWFIPIYLFIVLLLPILKSLRETKVRFLLIFVFIAMYFLSLLGTNALVQKVMFYIIWTYIGLFYEDIKRVLLKERKGKIRLLGVEIISACCLYICYKNGYSMDMQLNKFPPNIVFFWYSCCVMSFLGLIWPLINLLLENIKNIYWIKMFDVYSNNSMTIYLYQTFVFTIVVPFGKIMFPGLGAVIEGIQLLFYLVTIIPLCALSVNLFGRFENVQIKFKNVSN